MNPPEPSPPDAYSFQSEQSYEILQRSFDSIAQNGEQETQRDDAEFETGGVQDGRFEGDNGGFGAKDGRFKDSLVSLLKHFSKSQIHQKICEVIGTSTVSLLKSHTFVVKDENSRIIQKLFRLHMPPTTARDILPL